MTRLYIVIGGGPRHVLEGPDVAERDESTGVAVNGVDAISVHEPLGTEACQKQDDSEGDAKDGSYQRSGEADPPSGDGGQHDHRRREDEQAPGRPDDRPAHLKLQQEDVFRFINHNFGQYADGYDSHSPSRS